MCQVQRVPSMPYEPSDVVGYPSPPESSYQNISGIVSIVVEALMVFANIFPILVVCKWKRPRERMSTDEIIVALSITDILSVVIPSPLGLISYFSRRWYGGYRTCAFYQLTTSWFQLTSVFLVTYMCVDRFLVVRAATQQKIQIPSNPKVKVVVFAIYIFTLVISCLPLAGLAPEALSKSGKLCQSWIIAIPKEAKEHAFYISFISLGFINLLTVICVNSRVVCILKAFMKKLEQESKLEGKSLGLAVDKKAVIDCSKMVVMITVVSYLAWVPALIMILLLKIDHNISIAAVLYAMASTTLTGLFNPVIYGLFSPSYRQGYKGVLRSLCHILCGCRKEDFEIIDDVSTRASRLRSTENSSRSFASILSPTDRRPEHGDYITASDSFLLEEEVEPGNRTRDVYMSSADGYSAEPHMRSATNGRPINGVRNDIGKDNVSLTPRKFAKFSTFQNYIFSQKGKSSCKDELGSDSSLLSSDDEDSDGSFGCEDQDQRFIQQPIGVPTPRLLTTRVRVEESMI